MKKIKLDVNDLAIESFETVQPPNPDVGTVHGQSAFPAPTCQQHTCGNTYCGEPGGCNPASGVWSCNYLEPTCYNCNSEYGSCDCGEISGCDEPGVTCERTCGGHVDTAPCVSYLDCTYGCPAYTEPDSCYETT
jgi:hypothetical protein